MHREANTSCPRPPTFDMARFLFLKKKNIVFLILKNVRVTEEKEEEVGGLHYF